MALWACHGSISPLRVASLRPKVNLLQTHRFRVPKAPALYHNTQSSTTSITPGPTTWVDRLPPKFQPYLYLTRIDKPIGTFLLFYPCTWSITMASYALNAPPSVPLKYILLFGTGALIMRGAGCTINDLWDRNLDNAVERTKTRPLARGDLTPRQAVAFLAPQLTAGLAVLTQLNWYSIFLGASSLSLVITYPLMKRITYWPQAVLGACLISIISIILVTVPQIVILSLSLYRAPVHIHIPVSHEPTTLANHYSPLPVSTPKLRFRAKPILGLAFNWGALLGWSAVSGAVNWPVAGALYAGGVFWTLVYDSIYAHQDKTDDMRVGIRSTALLFGEHTRSILAAFSASSMSCIALAGYLNSQGAPFFIGTGLAAAQLARVIYRTDFDDRASCGRGFVACGFVGFWIWMGALGDYIWLRTEEEPHNDSNTSASQKP